MIPLVWVRGDEWRTPSRLDQVILPCVLGALYTIDVCIVISRCALRRLSGVHKNSHGAWPVAHATCESAGMTYCYKQDDRNDMTASIHVISGPKTALLILIKAGYFCLGCVTPPV